MGVYMYCDIITKGGHYVARDIVDWKDTEWFNDMQQFGFCREYELLPVEYGIPEKCPAEMQKRYSEMGWYGFSYMTVGDFIKWFEQYKPYRKAGYVDKYIAWLYEEKDICPKDDEVDRYIDCESTRQIWIEYNDIDEKSVWLRKEIAEIGCSDDCIICYCFG